MHLIAKHLDRSLIADMVTKDINTICLFSGKPITEGIHKKHLISERFTDTEFLRYPSDYISVEAALCISPVVRSEKGYNSLRNYSYMATEDELKILKREEIMGILLDPPKPPFIIAVTFSNKKHTAYKTIPAICKSSFFVTTDKGNVTISADRLHEIYPIIQSWYTIIPGNEGSTMKPTYFSKDEILYGSRNFKRIDEYGENKYFEENKAIDSFRHTLFLTLIVYLLNKKTC